MDSETWLEKAARLQRALMPSGQGMGFDDAEAAARDRIKIALWLKGEFEDPAASDESVFAEDAR